MKTLENLFFGNEIPFELPSLDREEYHRLVEELGEFEDPLFESLTKEQRQLYDDCLNIRMNRHILAKHIRIPYLINRYTNHFSAYFKI